MWWNILLFWVLFMFWRQHGLVGRRRVKTNYFNVLYSSKKTSFHYQILKIQMPADSFIFWRIVMPLVSKIITRMTCLFLKTRLIKFDWFLSTCMWIQNSSNKLKGCTDIKQRHKYILQAEEKICHGLHHCLPNGY